MRVDFGLSVRGVAALVAAVLMSGLALASSKSDPANPAQSIATSKTEINWRKSGMTQALEDAKAEGKPLLVFWGAVWCPPCNALKAKAFHDPKFVAATRPFIAVYLDGDSDEAQTWGEHFQASGYPTLLVLNPDGKEVQRLVTNDPLPNLIAELNHTREDLSSYDDLLNRATNAKAAKDVPDAAWERLAARDWLNDERWRDRGSELADQLETLANVFPTKLKVAHERVVLQSMLARALALKGKQTLPEARRKEWTAHLASVLKSPGEVVDQVGLLADSSGIFLKALFPGETRDSARDAFVDEYLNAFRIYRQNKNLTDERRTYSLEPFAELSQGSNPVLAPLKPGEAAAFKSEVDRQLKVASTQEKRIVAIDMLAEIYVALGRTSEAEKIAIGQLDNFTAKNEVMSLIAELESKQGHKNEAFKWRERAYREAQGGSTRLQWGVGYIQSLTTEEPHNIEKIESETKLLLRIR